ncbi:HNH endonuclease signature motif containing protein [Arthrobacter sp. B3I4]|uniref:HNH endonuclease signature motif containing protein n=1 Tax=Arthrobacter sp. B3I4 TaxID=3042267 RepID=UPI00278AB876|nr:HNH endonuclease signature motif containing protein [Arthrobacter sp. B3I4]MDQ0756046.1 hypothetical protein [Arthrobacter sp. B3I4]
MRSGVALSAESRSAVAALLASVTAFAASVGVGLEDCEPLNADSSTETGSLAGGGVVVGELVPDAGSSRDAGPLAAAGAAPGAGPLAAAGSVPEAGSEASEGAVFVEDPLREAADGCLDGLTGLARLEGQFAAVKTRLTAEYLGVSEALMPPVSAPQQRTVHRMSMVAELACVLTVSERSADALICQAVALTTALPLTLGALQAGQISWQHARIMVDETVNLDRAGAAALEAHFLAPYFPDLEVPDPARGCPAGELVPGRFRAKARTWRERHHPVSIEARHARGVQDRRVEFLPDSDGMAWYNTYLPADTAAGIWERTTATARALQGPAEGRNLTQLRADVTAGLLLTGEITGGTSELGSTSCTSGSSAPRTTGSSSGIGTELPTVATAGHRDGSGSELPTVATAGHRDGSGDSSEIGTGASWSGSTGSASGSAASGVRGAGLSGDVRLPRAQVLVTVPVLSLLGVTEEPAMLDGYGPIPPSMARRLVADGTDAMYRVLVDPRDGAPLEIGRKSYRPSKALRQWLRLRDAKCSFPGCNNASLDNETDHLLAWADGGTTGIANLGQACRKHHRLKHTTAWTPTGASRDHPPGWTSPTGRTYPSEHQDWEPPRLPDDILAIDVPFGSSLPLGWEPEPDAGLPPGGEPDLDAGLPPGGEPDLDAGLPPGGEPDLDAGLPPGGEPDFEPHLPPDPGLGPGAGPRPVWEPDIEFDPPPDSGPGADLPLPEDPFPDWHHYLSPAA